MPKIENPRVRKREGSEPSATTKPKTSAKLNVTKPGESEHLKLVLFGPPKTGKTTAAVSGSGRKLLILTEPQGDLPLVGRDDVDVVRPSTGNDISEIITALHAGAVSEYDRVVLDSATFAIEVVGSKAINKAIEAGRDTRNVYGAVGAAVSQYIHDLMALPVDVVITTQLRSSFDDDADDSPTVEEGNYPFTLAVTPMVYKVLAPAASVLGRTFKKMFVAPDGNKKVQFLVSFEDYGRSPAGSRISVPETMQDLDLDELKSAMKGEE